MFKFLGYLGYEIYFLLAKILPFKCAYVLADFVGCVVFIIKYAENKKRAVIIQKIHQDTIGISRARGLVLRSIRLFNRNLIDFFKSDKLNKSSIDSFIKITGLEYLNDALKKGRGVILASIHLGSWEMTGIGLAVKGYPAYGMIWNAGNKKITELFKSIRLKKGVGSVEIIHLLRIIDLLRKNKIIGIMLDINGGNKGIPYHVWGHDVKLPRGPAAIHIKNKAELLTVAAVRCRGGGYNIYIEKPDLAGSENEEEITIKIFEILKKYIEANPEQWHWIKYFF